LILRKCDSGRRGEIERIFEKQPFGELERLVTQNFWMFRRRRREELRSEEWLRLMAQLSAEATKRCAWPISSFSTPTFSTFSIENWVSFLNPMIESWDIDLKSFGLEIVLNRRLAPDASTVEFVERKPEDGVEPPWNSF